VLNADVTVEVIVTIIDLGSLHLASVLSGGYHGTCNELAIVSAGGNDQPASLEQCDRSAAAKPVFCGKCVGTQSTSDSTSKGCLCSFAPIRKLLIGSRS
jgi:hypothetical protein